MSYSALAAYLQFQYRTIMAWPSSAGVPLLLLVLDAGTNKSDLLMSVDRHIAKSLQCPETYRGCLGSTLRRRGYTVRTCTLRNKHLEEESPCVYVLIYMPVR